VALGIAGAAGSFGQFVMLPYGQTLINQIGWHDALLTLALTVLLMAPLAAALVEKRRHEPAGLHKQSIPEALREASRHKGYWLLCTAYTYAAFSSCSFRCISRRI